MVKPSIAELSEGNKYNRYTLVMAAAKGARYVIDKENYEKEHPEYEQYRVLTTGKKTEKSEEKPVKEAIGMLQRGEMCIRTLEEQEALAASASQEPEEQAKEEAAE